MAFTTTVTWETVQLKQSHTCSAIQFNCYCLVQVSRITDNVVLRSVPSNSMLVRDERGAVKHEHYTRGCIDLGIECGPQAWMSWYVHHLQIP